MPFIDCQQNLSKNNEKVMYKSLSNRNFNIKKIIIGHICYSNQNFLPSTQNFVWIKICF
jgi:hypothetical protein